MKHYASAMSWVLFALCGPAAAAAQPTQAQHKSGLAVLAQARTASGGAAWERVGGLVGQGKIQTSGLPGTWSRVEDWVRGRSAIAVDVGIFRIAEGDDGHRHWRQDPSGGVHALNSAFAKTAATTDTWLTRRGWLRPQADQAHVGPAATRTEAGRRYVVIEAVPRAGQPVELWFDAGSHLLDRTVRQMPISTQTVRYADYRKVAGLQLPFTIESRDSSSPDVETVHVDRWTLQGSLQDASFAAPPPPDDTALEGETTVAVEVDGFVTVEARLNGKSFWFILDTGGHNIITPAAAEALGVKPVGAGASGGAGSGSMAQQYVRIDRLDVGAATLRDQHFYVLPLSYDTIERGAREPLAGLLGLELFERFGARLDYPAKTLTLKKLAGYEHRGSGVAVPIRFEDDMPQLDGRIAGAPGVIALDTGNGSTTVVQGAWARKHGLAEQLKHGIETVSYGAGGASSNWASRIDSLEIGGTVLQRPIVRYAEDRAGAFSSRTEAANIGTDVLSHFVLDFDYGHDVIWFEHQPGPVSLPFSRSGVRAVKEGPESFVIVMVYPGSPAANAGLDRHDRIVAVDGVPAARISGRELGRRFTQPVGTKVALTMKRDESQHEVTLELAELLP